MHSRTPRPWSLFTPATPHALPGMRIGLLGGSFNPAHAGHRRLSEIARRRLGLDRVWWIVSPGNPLKRHDDLAPLDARVAEARRVAGAHWIEVTAFEAALGSVYTVDTLTFLRARHPRVHFVWLIGADNLASIHRWRHWTDIFAQMPVAVTARPGWQLYALASPAARTYSSARRPEREAATIAARKPPAWVLLTGPMSGLSSTAIRAGRAAPRG